MFNLIIKLRRRRKNAKTPRGRKEVRWGRSQLNKLVIGLIKHTQYIVICFKISEHS